MPPPTTLDPPAPAGHAPVLDPSGVPLDLPVARWPRPRSHASLEVSLARAHAGYRILHVPGLPPSTIAVVEALAADDGDRVELWATWADRPVLVEVDAGSAREMLADLRAGHHPTAIIEPGQVL
ncbi:MAG TPA: hypothetical protein VFY23_07830, partial [Candidatus Limnocylindrales bacterium]|nr:hypothetical protein [Candidatus Limnocylindrales bacterium]